MISLKRCVHLELKKQIEKILLSKYSQEIKKISDNIANGNIKENCELEGMKIWLLLGKKTSYYQYEIKLNDFSLIMDSEGKLLDITDGKYKYVFNALKIYKENCKSLGLDDSLTVEIFNDKLLSFYSFSEKN